jgi:hypothetical protein
VTSTIYTELESNRRMFVCLGREVWDLTQPDVFAQ